MKKAVISSLFALSILSVAADFYYENGQKVEVSKLYEKRSVEQNASIKKVTYYKTSKGHKVGVLNEILVQCKTGINCKELLNKYDIASVTALSDTIFLVNIATDQNVFEISQKLYEDKDVELAHPNFVKEKKRR